MAVGLEPAFIVVRIHENCVGKLFDVVDAHGSLGAFFGFLERRQKHRRKNGDDGDNDEQLDQSEPAAGRDWRQSGRNGRAKNLHRLQSKDSAPEVSKLKTAAMSNDRTAGALLQNDD